MWSGNKFHFLGFFHHWWIWHHPWRANGHHPDELQDIQCGSNNGGRLHWQTWEKRKDVMDIALERKCKCLVFVQSSWRGLIVASCDVQMRERGVDCRCICKRKSRKVSMWIKFSNLFLLGGKGGSEGHITLGVEEWWMMLIVHGKEWPRNAWSQYKC